MNARVNRVMRIFLLVFAVNLCVVGCYEAAPIDIPREKAVTVTGIEGHYVTNDGVNIIIEMVGKGGFYSVTKWSTNKKHDQDIHEYSLYFVQAKSNRLVGVVPYFKPKINFLNIKINRDEKNNIVSLQFGVWEVKNKEGRPWLVRVLRRHGLSIEFNFMTAEIVGLNNHEDLQALFSDEEFLDLSQASLTDNVFVRTNRISAQSVRGDSSYKERAKKATASYLNDLNQKQQAVTRKLQAQYNKMCGFDFNCWRLDSGAWIYQTYDQQYWYFESGEIVPKDKWPY